MIHAPVWWVKGGSGSLGQSHIQVRQLIPGILGEEKKKKKKKQPGPTRHESSPLTPDLLGQLHSPLVGWETTAGGTRIQPQRKFVNTVALSFFLSLGSLHIG